MEQKITQLLLALSHYPIAANIVVFTISFLESFAFIGLAVPGAVFAVTAGILASKGIYSLYYLILSGSVGAILSDLAGFYLARCYGEVILRWQFVSRHQTAITKGRDFFRDHGGKSVFIGRFVGLVRPVVPFIAGLLGMSPLVFWFYATTSGLLWGIAYIGGGYFFGRSWIRIESQAGWLGGILFAGIFCGYIFRSRLVRFWRSVVRRASLGGQR